MALWKKSAILAEKNGYGGTMDIEKYLPYLLVAVIAVSVLAAYMVNH